MEGAAVVLLEALELSPDMAADVEHVDGGLARHAAHFEPASEIDHAHLGELADQIEGHLSHSLPDLRVRPRADMAVQPGDTQPESFCELMDLIPLFVPNAEA